MTVHPPGGPGDGERTPGPILPVMERAWGQGGAWLTALAVAAGTAFAGEVPVRVVVDMDAATPGIQPSVAVPACRTTVRDVAVYVLDPLGSRAAFSIGFIGGIDRGIAFGHMIGDTHEGIVAAVIPFPGAPLNPASVAMIAQTPGLDPAFDGPEVQYVETGATVPVVIPAAPSAPLFTVDIELDAARPGDRFSFYLLDFVAVWAAGRHGAFSATAPVNALDTGGDAVPDGTLSVYGVDPDAPIPVPPASFPVDFIDGAPGPGGATVEVVAAAAGDVDCSGAVDVSDLLAVLAEWGPCPGCPEDADGSGVVDVADVLLVLAGWG